MQHYEERLERDLAALRQLVDEIGELLDRAVGDATRAFLHRDADLAAETILRDKRINRATRKVDRLCHQFVARHLPSARALRYISAVLRLSTALERIGDYAVSIAKGAVQMRSDEGPAIVDRDIEMLAEQARSMLKQSLDAFRTLNAEMARGTRTMESQADALYRKVYRDLLAEGEGGNIPLRDLFACLATLNRLERISDQAGNICEETLFAATGETKQPKRYRILFLDDRNAVASLMAHGFARKAYTEGGQFTSAGWAPAESVDAGLVAFMEQRGQDMFDLVPRKFDPMYDRLRHFHVIVALSPDARDHIPELPYSTVLLDWSDEVAGAGGPEPADDAAREDLYKRLAVRIRDLMEMLHGDNAA